MSKTILIFDMDGVLLKPRGYHRALQDTVRFGAQEMGYEGVEISDTEIAQFEGLGLSSEWHSSAACMSVLMINGSLSLEPLFTLLKGEPAQIPARIRLERAIQKMSKDAHVHEFVQESETFHSSTFRIFQELILGSADFERIYGEKSSLDIESYLLRFDKPLLGTDVRKRLFAWLEDPEHGCAIMTNRPSRQMPDAEYGRRLVGLGELSLVGNNDIEWLAKEVGEETSALLKPAPTHALAAAFTSLGKPVDESLLSAYAATKGSFSEDLSLLKDSQIWVFEDTPAGIISVGKMGDFLIEHGFSVKINKVGIAETSLKGGYLEVQGAQVFESIDLALRMVLN